MARTVVNGELQALSNGWGASESIGWCATMMSIIVLFPPGEDLLFTTDTRFPQLQMS